MASSNNEINPNSSIIRQLINRVDELSQAISPSDHVRNNNINNDVNGEVRRIFNTATSTEARSGPSGVGRATSQINNGVGITRAMTATTTSPATPIPSSSRAERLPMRRNAFAMRRNFPSQRPQASSSRRRGNRVNTVDNRPFLRDLVLLSGPEETLVPRQGARLLLSEHGHVITACHFTKNLTPAQVEISIIEAFDGKIPAGVDIELLMSVHTSLVAPTLAPGQAGIDGVILHRLFKQKPVYIRPSCRLISTAESQTSSEMDTTSQDESSFPVENQTDNQQHLGARVAVPEDVFDDELQLPEDAFGDEHQWQCGIP